MMKVIKEVELDICDFCKEDDTYFWNVCLGCDKIMCHNCIKTSAIRYQHSVKSTGYRDGLYCHNCDKKLDDDRLHLAYVRIAALRQEAKDWDIVFRFRSDEADKNLKQILVDRRLPTK